MEEKTILEEIKENVGAASDQFDGEIKMYINSLFGTLDQIGVGPYAGFQITGDETWDCFSTDIPLVNMVKEYLTIQTKILFDGSTMSSSYMQVLKDRVAELEWRMNGYVDNM